MNPALAGRWVQHQLLNAPQLGGFRIQFESAIDVLLGFLNVAEPDVGNGSIVVRLPVSVIELDRR